MATINLNSIQYFFENGLSYFASKLKEITPIFPYSFVHIKEMFYFFHKKQEIEIQENSNVLNNRYPIPNYALSDVNIDFDNLSRMNMNEPIYNGLYYIVLADLVGSTKFLEKYGNEKAAARIINFVQAGIKALVKSKKVNKAYFLKEVGDSVLLIFTHASDIVQWNEQFREELYFRSSFAEEEFEIRTCVHVGEVCLHDANPLCLSVSETFKMEKQVGAGKLVFSELAAKVAKPALCNNDFSFKPYGMNETASNLQELIANQLIEIVST